MMSSLLLLACVGATLAAPTSTLSTAVASPSAASNAPLPSQAALPPNQSWCPSEIFCAGDLLQTVNVASLVTDPKTIVDKPTNQAPSVVLSDFAAIPSPRTYGAITRFVESDFTGEGLELEQQPLASFNPDPLFLNEVKDPVLKAWSRVVHGFWKLLIRGTNNGTLCDGSVCENSLIPLNHTLVVPGGRFREQYYWDSYWIILGLIQSELYDVANSILQNFMDELEHMGFIPNGGRIYYLNRSQPPLFTHMLTEYVTATKDVGILNRALPLAERELDWWKMNRTIEVTSPFTNETHSVARYSVVNSAPRPESYLTDYTLANDPKLPTLNESQRSALYAELASGAETGWDYTARWLANPSVGLRTLNVRSTIPICLNSILYRAHLNLADLYDQTQTCDRSAAARHRDVARSLRTAIIDLFWDEDKLAFYDFNLTSNERSAFFSAAAFYPFWNGIVPDEVLSGQDKAFGVFSSLYMVMTRYNGTFPSSFVDTGLQWDAPNAWPPHQYILLAALRTLPTNLTSNALPIPHSNESTFSLIPPGQVGLSEDGLPGQPLIRNLVSTNASSKGAAADINKNGVTIVNGGSAMQGEGWAAALGRQLANRYVASTFCSWHATGGEVPGVLPRLSDSELNVTKSLKGTGNMFEKFSNVDVDSAGRGGEYTVQAGFGWTNGVVLWIAKNYGQVLERPACPDLLGAKIDHVKKSTATRLVARASGGTLMVVVWLVISPAFLA